MLTALVSLVAQRSVNPALAMTGEITLRGSVTAVGGIKEKVLAAHRAGIKKIILSERNRKDIQDVPEEVRNELQFVCVNRVEELIRHALEIDVETRNLALNNDGGGAPAVQI
jgi:ATP-dependent Lon protease